MALKIAGYLFTGPYEIEKTIVRRNHAPVVYAILSKEGPPWDPIFRVIEVGASGDDGISFSSDQRRDSWKIAAKGQLCLYLMPLEGSDGKDPAIRKQLATEISKVYVAPNDIITAIA